MDRPRWSVHDYRNNCLLTPPHQAVFNHRTLFEDHGGFDTTLSILIDYDFLLRDLLRAQPLYIPNFTVSNMQIGGISSSRRHVPKFMLELIRLYKRHINSIPPVLYWWLIKAWTISILYRLVGDRLTLSITNVYRRVVGGRPPLAY